MMSIKNFALKSIVLTIMLTASYNCIAIEPVSYGEAVVGPLKHATELKALGPNLFGEEISAYTGGISFSQTDLSLPGNDDLPVAVTRRLVVDGNKSPSVTTDANLWDVYAFGEWELDLPYLSGMYSEVQGWVVDTASPNARCSSPTTYNQFRPSDVGVGALNRVNFTSYSFWNGLQLNMPGAGEEQLLYRPSGGSLPMPSTGTWTALTTKSQWHFGCLPGLQSGQSGEGFLAMAPDGTRYWFDWMVSYPERPLRGIGHIIDSTGFVRRTEADLSRRVYRLYPTRVEDRFGNYVAYAWSGDKLTTITASDGRTISLVYNGARIVSAKAG